MKSTTLITLFLLVANINFAQTTSMKKNNSVEPREVKEVPVVDTVQVNVSTSKLEEPVKTPPVQEDPNKTNPQQAKEVIHTSRKRP